MIVSFQVFTLKCMLCFCLITTHNFLVHFLMLCVTFSCTFWPRCATKTFPQRLTLYLCSWVFGVLEKCYAQRGEKLDYKENNFGDFVLWHFLNTERLPYTLLLLKPLKSNRKFTSVSHPQRKFVSPKNNSMVLFIFFLILFLNFT